MLWLKRRPRPPHNPDHSALWPTMPQKEQRDEQCECLIAREPDLPPTSRWVVAVEGVGRSLRVEKTFRNKEGKWERRTASKTCPSTSGLMKLMACLRSCREPP